MNLTRSEKSWREAKGYSIVEMLACVVIIMIIGTMALPQLHSARRHLRNAGFSREVTTQLRYARQRAISGQRAVTFQFDDSAKTINVIDHGDVNPAVPVANRGLAWKDLMSHANYPNTPNSSVVRSVSLDAIGIPAGEFVYGIPSLASLGNNNKLGDDTSYSPLVSGKLNITFQSDGSVVNSSNRPTSKVICFYNQHNPHESAVAISVLGAAGRVKIWRYNNSANKYAE